MVKGWQNGRWIVSAVCSFQKPEFDQPSHCHRMPMNVLPPESYPEQEGVYRELAAKPGITTETRLVLLAHAEQIRGFPIEVKTAGSFPTANGLTEDVFWMRLKAMPTQDIAFRTCVLAFLSDLNILSTVARAVSLVRGAATPNRLSMISSLDHSVWFYDDDFDLTEWIMFVMVSPLVGKGRGIVYGRLYTRDARLIAIANQEGSTGGARSEF
ncbi:thioesterase family protein [Ceratobasidium sp. AG-Ba]|nr:thioesterase family protein [Ceratobasidium sp. AG-Ba]